MLKVHKSTGLSDVYTTENGMKISIDCVDNKQWSWILQSNTFSEFLYKWDNVYYFCTFVVILEEMFDILKPYY